MFKIVQNVCAKILYFAMRAVTVVVVLTKSFGQCYYVVLSNVFASYTERPRLILSIEFRKIRPLDKLLISCAKEFKCQAHE